jgi:osmotically-inducible protein OsmY
MQAEKSMNKATATAAAAWSLCVILISALGGCATYEKCGLEGCASDRKVSAQVQELLNAHPELGPPGSITVETLNGVVYLDGVVTGGLEKRNVEAIVRQASGVKRVVNGVSVEHS